MLNRFSLTLLRHPADATPGHPWLPLRCAILLTRLPAIPGLRCVAPSWRKKAGCHHWSARF